MRRILFEKTGNGIWISHLDLMRILQRAFRRSGILLKHTQGFPGSAPFRGHGQPVRAVGF